MNIKFRSFSRFVQDNKWNEALNLCRSIDETPLWACLAGLACQTNNELLDVAEEAFAEIGQYDKVLFIQHVKVKKYFTLRETIYL